MAARQHVSSRVVFIVLSMQLMELFAMLAFPIVQFAPMELLVLNARIVSATALLIILVMLTAQLFLTVLHAHLSLQLSVQAVQLVIH
jgi:hypothetical protein